jgi:hypothetical protein
MDLSADCSLDCSMDHVPSFDGTTSYRPQSSRVNAVPLAASNTSRTAAALGHSPDLVKGWLLEVLIGASRIGTSPHHAGRRRLIANCG